MKEEWGDKMGSRKGAKAFYLQRKYKLSEQQLKFIECFKGDADKAALEAGYKMTTSLTHWRRKIADLMRNPMIQAEIEKKNPTYRAPSLNTKLGRKAWLEDKIINEAKYEVRDRLKAFELLGRMEGDFIDRVEHSGQMTFEQYVEASLAGQGKSPKEIAANVRPLRPYPELGSPEEEAEDASGQ